MLKLLFTLSLVCVSLNVLSGLTWNHIRNNRYGLVPHNVSNHQQTIARRSFPAQHHPFRANQSFHRRVIATSFNRSMVNRQSWWFQRQQEQRRTQSFIGRRRRPTARFNRSYINREFYRNRPMVGQHEQQRGQAASIYSNRVGALQLRQHPLMNNSRTTRPMLNHPNINQRRQRVGPFFRHQWYNQPMNVSRLNNRSFIRRQN